MTISDATDTCQSVNSKHSHAEDTCQRFSSKRSHTIMPNTPFVHKTIAAKHAALLKNLPKKNGLQPFPLHPLWLSVSRALTLSPEAGNCLGLLLVPCHVLGEEPFGSRLLGVLGSFLAPTALLAHAHLIDDVNQPTARL